MPKYAVYGIVTASKHMGEYEAPDAKAAAKLAWDDAHVMVCHECARDVEDPEIFKLVVENVDDSKDTFEDSYL